MVVVPRDRNLVTTTSARVRTSYLTEENASSRHEPDTVNFLLDTDYYCTDQNSNTRTTVHLVAPWRMPVLVKDVGKSKQP